MPSYDDDVVYTCTAYHPHRQATIQGFLLAGCFLFISRSKVRTCTQFVLTECVGFYLETLYMLELMLVLLLPHPSPLSLPSH